MKTTFFLSFAFVLGLSVASAYPAIAQIVGETKIFSDSLRPADLKYASTTFETYDTMTVVKENYNNNKEIIVRLDKIIYLLRQQND